MSSHDLGICMKLVAISNPFDANKLVELKFRIPECDPVSGGELRLRVDLESAKKYMLGDKYYIRLSSI